MDTPHDEHALAERVALLEARLRQLEDRLAAQTGQAAPPAPAGSALRQLTAPLEARDSTGRLLLEFHVERDDVSVRLFNAQGHIAVALGVDGAQGGYLAIRNAEGRLVGLWDVESYGARLQLLGAAGNGGVTLLAGEAGNERDGGQLILHAPDTGERDGARLALSASATGAEVEADGDGVTLQIGGADGPRATVRVSEDGAHVVFRAE